MAIIPARGGSKRLPRKNILTIAGKPMLWYPVKTAQESGIFDRIVVSTEDDEIAQIAKEAGAEVSFRPSKLATDEAKVIDVCADYITQIISAGYRPDNFCCIYPTAIFLTEIDIKHSFRLLDSSPEADVVMGVSRYPIHPYKALCRHNEYLKPVWPEENDKKSQEFPCLVASNGTFYWARTTTFMQEKTFFTNRLRGYELPLHRTVDLDTQEDFEWLCQLAALYFNDAKENRKSK